MQKFKLQLVNLGGIKFLLIILIVCIHASPSVRVELTYTNAFQIYFSQVISRIAVPIYFFISGYLMEIGLKNYTKWRQKISRRIITILVPYLLWNAIYGLFLLGLSSIYSYNTSISSEDTVLQISKHIFIDPAISPLWFLRDLFIFQLTSVLLIALSYRIRVLVLLLLLILWLYDFHIPYTIISSEGALFFTLGFFNWLPIFKLFKDISKEGPDFIQHPADQSGNSTASGTSFVFRNGDVVFTDCMNWSEEMKPYIDNLSVNVRKEEFNLWLK